MRAMAGVTSVRTRPALVAGACVAGAGYLALVDPTQPGAAALPCPFRAITGLDCPFCGSTRAAWALVHLEPVRALGFNALLVALLPLAAWAWLLDAQGRFAESSHPFRRHRFWLGAVGVAVAFGVLRNLPWDPWRVLGT